MWVSKPIKIDWMGAGRTGVLIGVMLKEFSAINNSKSAIHLSSVNSETHKAMGVFWELWELWYESLKQSSYLSSSRFAAVKR